MTTTSQQTTSAPSAPRKRYIIHHASEAFQPQPPITWIIDGIVAEGSVNLFFGEAGCKKTRSLLDMGVCVATGEDWLTFHTTQSTVLFIDEESGDARIKTRLREAMLGHGASDTLPLFFITFARFNLCGKKDEQEIINAINDTGARLVIIDALVELMAGADENSTKDVMPVFMKLINISRKTGAAICLIHHANRSGGYRGNSSIMGACDTMIQIESKVNSPNIDFGSTKVRDTAPFSFSAVAHFGLDDFTLTSIYVSHKVQKLSKSKEYVVQFLKTNGASTIEDIMNNADTCSDKAARQAVYDLAADGTVYRTNAGGQGLSATYDLTSNKPNPAAQAACNFVP